MPLRNLGIKGENPGLHSDLHIDKNSRVHFKLYSQLGARCLMDKKDLKEKLPSLEEVTWITKKLYTDIKKSIKEIASEYKNRKEHGKPEAPKPFDVEAESKKNTVESSSSESPSSKDKDES